MNRSFFPLAFLCLYISIQAQDNPQIINNHSIDWGGYKMVECSEGTCAVYSKKSTNHEANQMPPDAVWDEPIRVHFFIDDQIVVNEKDIQATLEEDSQIAIDDGLYTGEGLAYIYTGQAFIDLSELEDLGFPLRTDIVLAAVSSIDDMNVGLGTIYDDQLNEAKNCYGAHKFNAIIRDGLDGVQEVSTLSLGPDNDFSFPGAAFKTGAHNGFNFRNHAISHHAGQNSSEHQFGADPTKRPMLTEEGKSYGWSTTGLIGFSGGTAIGIGDEGENIAGYIRATFSDWVTIIPNLKIENLQFPTTINETEMAEFSASSNKDIGNENWLWEFTNGVDVVSSEENNPSILFPSPGQWSFIVRLSNECGGQVVVEQGSIEVTMSGTNTTDALEARIRIFPTPFQNQITIVANDLSITKVEIYDVSGKKMIETYGDSQINTSQLISGVYQIRLKDSRGRSYVKKIVKL